MSGSELSDGSSRNCFSAATRCEAKLNSIRGVDETRIGDVHRILELNIEFPIIVSNCRDREATLARVYVSVISTGKESPVPTSTDLRSVARLSNLLAGPLKLRVPCSADQRPLRCQARGGPWRVNCRLPRGAEPHQEIDADAGVREISNCRHRRRRSLGIH